MQRKLDGLWKESKKAGLEINSSKTEEMRVNTVVNQGLKLNGEDIKSSSYFCYLGSIVTENWGTSREVNVWIQKARGSFSKLRKVRLSKSLRKYIKIRIFNACVKSVLLYGCETWLVTDEIQRRIQTFVNRCLRYRAWMAIGDRLQAPSYLSRVDHHWKIRVRKQRRDIGKYSFVNRSITDWNQLPEGAIGTFHGKTQIFKTRITKV